MASTLIWFNQNLRLHDNHVFKIASETQQPLICWYCIDPAWFKSDQFGLLSMGPHRWRFLIESLQVFAQQLASVGQRLFVSYGEPITMLGKIIKDYDVNCVVSQYQSGLNEQQQWMTAKKQYANLRFLQPHSFTLFEPEQLQSVSNFPLSFSQFRRQVEKIEVSSPVDCPIELPPYLKLHDSLLGTGPSVDSSQPAVFSGGELAAIAHLKDYFNSNAASCYKETRNGLMGWTHSTKFSAWLANGSLSARYLLQTLKHYEAENGANDSTYWVYFELLWREYFQWYAMHFKHQLFTFQGISQRKPLTSFYPQRFKQWVEGMTAWPIVNACMQELKQTGYLSNRGRQIVASCLVNEMSLDWRCGAAYFEQQLVDYDVASNWGNWQYIAGVGADPRGGRHFNLQKQTETYDPNNEYRQRWLGEHHGSGTGHSASSTMIDLVDSFDSVDMVDWPVKN